jgi:tRNA G18 (ribose-2'-O)-methylase SpoU
MDFLYGKNAILSALMNNRRNFAQLYLYSNPSSTQQQQQQLTAIDSAKLNEIKRLCAERRVRIQPVMSRNRLSAMIGSSEGMRQHQGVVLECSPLPVLDFNDDVVIANRLNSTKRQRPQPRPHVLVYLDKITDAFNIGAIARNAAFFGVDTLLLSDGCAPVNNVVAATSVGAVDQLELYRVASSSLLLSAERFGDRLSLFAGSLPTSTSTTTTITDLNDVVRSDVNIVMLGSEGKGISRSLLNSRYVKQFYISGSTTLMNQQQQRQPLDSLNVAVSCGIALHAFTRPSQKSD